MVRHIASEWWAAAVAVTRERGSAHHRFGAAGIARTHCPFSILTQLEERERSIRRSRSRVLDGNVWPRWWTEPLGDDPDRDYRDRPDAAIARVTDDGPRSSTLLRSTPVNSRQRGRLGATPGKVEYAVILLLVVACTVLVLLVVRDSSPDGMNVFSNISNSLGT
jgi:hypothetical protein